MSYQNGPPKIVTDGLVLMLDPIISKSYPGSGNTIYDLSGWGNNGTINGATYWSDGRGSFYFDGNDYVTGSISSLTNWTISLWYLSKEIDQQTVYYPFGIGNSYGLGFSGSYTTGTQSKWYFYTGGILSSSNTIISANQWYHLCVSKYNTTYNLYTYGALSLSATSADRSLTSYSLGMRTDSAWHIKGLISCSKIYNRTLSSSEILQNYNATKYRFGL